MNDKIEQLKNEIERLKKLHLKPISKKSDFNYLSEPLDKTKQVQKITESLTEYLNKLTKEDIDETTIKELNKVVDSEISNLLNSIYS